MNRSQRAALKKERHANQVARRLQKKQARMQTDPEDDDLDLEAVEAVAEDEAEPRPETSEDDVDEDDDLGEDEEESTRDVDNFAGVKKDYGYSDPSVDIPAPMGPTSWDELDAARMAEMQASDLRMASYDVQDLVRNILNHPVMEAADKATAIQDVGTGFQSRVDSILAGPSAEPVQKDIDLLEIEAILAFDRRHTSVAEHMGDWITKAKLSYAAKKAKPDSAYALVTTRGGKKVRKYLIHDKAHVRNALARAAQQMKGGGPGAADARAALPKIHAAAKRMGIGMGKELNSTIILEKDAKGDWRWVGWPSNNFLDLQGDIISKDAHIEFCKFLDENPTAAPLFMSWHLPGTERKHPVDYWHFENGFLIMSGVLEQPEAASLFKALAATDLGMSMQGFGLRESGDPRVVTKYRVFEVSDLPLDHAANPFTDFSVIVKEVDMDKLAYLATLLGSKEKAEAYMAKAGIKQEVLQNAGIESKSTDPKPAAAPATPPVVEKVQTAVAKAQAAPADAKDIIAAVLKELDVEGLNAFLTEAKTAMDKVPVLEDVIKSMQAGADQALAEKITPPASKFVWMRSERASTSDSTKVTEDEKDKKLSKSAPGLGANWLNEITGTQPMEVEEVRA